MLYILLQTWNLLSVLLWYKFLDNKLKYVIDKNTVHGLLGFFFAGIFITFSIRTLHAIYPLTFLVESVFESDFFYNILVTGMIEEFAKWVAFILIAHYLGTIKEPQDGVLQGAAVGLGFAFVENVIYINIYTELFIAIRPILNTGGHMLYGAVWGGMYSAAMWSNIQSKDPGSYHVAFIGLFGMAFFHGLYNSVVIYGLVFGFIVKAIILYFAFTLFITLTKHSPYRKYALHQAKIAIPSLKRGLFFNRKSPILNSRMGTYLMYLGKYKHSIDYFNYAIPWAFNKERIRFLAGVCEYAYLNNAKGKERLRKTWGRFSDTDRKKAIKQLEMILEKDKPLYNRVVQFINSPFSINQEKQGYALAQELKRRKSNKKNLRKRPIEHIVNSLTDEEKKDLRKKLDL